MHTLNALLAPYAARVEAEMKRHIPELNNHRTFFGQIYYHLGWATASYDPVQHPGGKRVRAALCLMTCEAFSGSSEQALAAAAAVELLHEFSLIHDDIEDGDRSRRHRPTLWTLVGQPQAINAGDGLFALAQKALLSSTQRGVPPETVLRALDGFNDAAVRLCIGQHSDMSFEQQELISPEAYLAMIGGKTASLLAFSGEVGALMAGADEKSITAVRNLGEALGLAFQMRDDLLGLCGDPALTGKPVGADIQARKKSLPVAYALSQPDSRALRMLYAGPLDSPEVIAEANRLIEASGAREYVSALAREQEQRAQSMLNEINVPSGALLPLRQLCELLTGREH